MTLGEMLCSFCEHDPVPVEAMEAALAAWDDYAPAFRAMLDGYVRGEDLSERTERALHVIVHLMAEKADKASFGAVCLLAEQTDRFDSVFGTIGATLSFAPVLVSLFDGDPAPLMRLIDNAGVEDYTRCEALLVLAYLACTERTAKAPLYDYLFRLGANLPDEAIDLGYGFARAVATLGFTGLSGLVEAGYRQGRIDDIAYKPADFWRDLRDTQASGPDLSDPIWADMEPIDSAVDQLMLLANEETPGWNGAKEPAGYHVQEPIRNPLRSVGRNDPCPCGSGRKYKKCCLQPS